MRKAKLFCPKILLFVGDLAPLVWTIFFLGVVNPEQETFYDMQSRNPEIPGASTSPALLVGNYLTQPVVSNIRVRRR